MSRARLILVAAGAAVVLLSACGGPKGGPDVAEAEQSAHITAAVTAMADDWDGDVQFTTHFNALDPSLTMTVTDGLAVVFDPNDDYWGLPRDEGYDLVDGFCSGCHSLQIVMQQRKTEEHWSELITWMINTQGMTPLPEDVRQEIEGYLGRNFGENSP